MLKKVVAVVLIILSAGTWGYLDYLNKQEIKAAAEMRAAMEQARAQAMARAKAAAFEATLLTELETCKATAEQAKEDFLVQNRKPVRRKRGEFTIPQAALDEADKKLEEANAACQTNYDTRLNNGS